MSAICKMTNMYSLRSFSASFSPHQIDSGSSSTIPAFSFLILHSYNIASSQLTSDRIQQTHQGLDISYSIKLHLPGEEKMFALKWIVWEKWK